MRHQRRMHPAHDGSALGHGEIRPRTSIEGRRAASMAARAAAPLPTRRMPDQALSSPDSTPAPVPAVALPAPVDVELIDMSVGSIGSIHPALLSRVRQTGTSSLTNDLGGAQADHHGGRIGIAGDQRGHDGGVRNAHVLDTSQAQLGIERRRPGPSPMRTVPHTWKAVEPKRKNASMISRSDLVCGSGRDLRHQPRRERRLSRRGGVSNEIVRSRIGRRLRVRLVRLDVAGAPPGRAT